MAGLDVIVGTLNLGLLVWFIYELFKTITGDGDDDDDDSGSSKSNSGGGFLDNLFGGGNDKKGKFKRSKKAAPAQPDDLTKHEVKIKEIAPNEIKEKTKGIEIEVSGSGFFQGIQFKFKKGAEASKIEVKEINDLRKDYCRLVLDLGEEKPDKKYDLVAFADQKIDENNKSKINLYTLEEALKVLRKDPKEDTILIKEITPGKKLQKPKKNKQFKTTLTISGENFAKELSFKTDSPHAVIDTVRNTENDNVKNCTIVIGDEVGDTINVIPVLGDKDILSGQKELNIEGQFISGIEINEVAVEKYQQRKDRNINYYDILEVYVIGKGFSQIEDDDSIRIKTTPSSESSITFDIESDELIKIPILRYKESDVTLSTQIKIEILQEKDSLCDIKFKIPDATDNFIKRNKKKQANPNQQEEYDDDDDDDDDKLEDFDEEYLIDSNKTNKIIQNLIKTPNNLEEWREIQIKGMQYFETIKFEKILSYSKNYHNNNWENLNNIYKSYQSLINQSLNKLKEEWLENNKYKKNIDSIRNNLIKNDQTLSQTIKTNQSIENISNILIKQYLLYRDLCTIASKDDFLEKTNNKSSSDKNITPEKESEIVKQVIQNLDSTPNNLAEWRNLLIQNQNHLETIKFKEKIENLKTYKDKEEVKLISSIFMRLSKQVIINLQEEWLTNNKYKKHLMIQKKRIEFYGDNYNKKAKETFEDLLKEFEQVIRIILTKDFFEKSINKDNNSSIFGELAEKTSIIPSD